MDRLNRLLNSGGFGGMGGGAQQPGGDSPQVDNAEIIYISPLSLLKVWSSFNRPANLKMLKHARAGVPMEVMGLMLGEFVDEYTISVVDVFAMPQSGTGVSVEAVDDVFQTQMMEFALLFRFIDI
jgi:26S proteasome regulatory subunit N11